MIKKLLIAAGIIAILGFGFLWWYDATYSMEIVDAKEIGAKNSTFKFLIASQGSEYKNALVDGIMEHLKGKPVYLKIIDVSSLESINPDDWNGLIILHTWEVWKPESHAATFVSKFYDSDKMFIVSTSGSGDRHLEGVDGITSASLLEKIPEDTKLLQDWLNEKMVNERVE